ncbi:MAG: 30S ribosomal protein S7 [bacterium]
MPRRQTNVERHEIEPDPVHGSRLIARLINKVMRDGKRSLAENIVYSALDIVQDRTGEDPMMVFNNAIDNVRPKLEVRPRRVGGATFQVPMEVDKRRSLSLAIRWIRDAARDRSEFNMEDRLANELMDASNYTGAAFNKRENVHKMAEANRAFAHYRW